MSFDEIMQLTGRWGGTLKFFPSGANERIAIAEAIVEMCSDIDQVRWLVKRVPDLYREWPGIYEVRAVLCSKFKPADGHEVYSEIHLDGIPAEHEPVRQQIAAPAKRADVKELTASPSLQNTTADLAAALDLEREALRRSRPAVRDIPLRQIPTEQLITAEDVQREIERQRELKRQRALEVSGLT